MKYIPHILIIVVATVLILATSAALGSVPKRDIYGPVKEEKVNKVFIRHRSRHNIRIQPYIPYRYQIDPFRCPERLRPLWLQPHDLYNLEGYWSSGVFVL